MGDEGTAVARGAFSAASANAVPERDAPSVSAVPEREATSVSPVRERVATSASAARNACGNASDPSGSDDRRSFVRGSLPGIVGAGNCISNRRSSRS
jgi:hypothetical protein